MDSPKSAVDIILNSMDRYHPPTQKKRVFQRKIPKMTNIKCMIDLNLM